MKQPTEVSFVLKRQPESELTTVILNHPKGALRLIVRRERVKWAKEELLKGYNADKKVAGALDAQRFRRPVYDYVMPPTSLAMTI